MAQEPSWLGSGCGWYRCSPGVVVLLVIGIHLLEGYITGPLVMGRALRLPPAAVLLALSVGGVLGGVWGLLFAAPATACGLAVWRWSAGDQGPLGRASP